MYRCEPRVLWGVCSGIAAHFDVAPLPVRVLFILASCATLGIGVIVYFVFAFSWPFVPGTAEVEVRPDWSQADNCKTDSDPAPSAPETEHGKNHPSKPSEGYRSL